ncbi:sialidase family protein [Pedobacter mucosus]|uniref:sialidase family protein n=1 Tax=Pedobacter mucosus TaxID=2895286 RepID=UPI001EE41047|nr:sialidase family protein [Pedobacter mucosus]UKT65974.1 glycoside hydrolase [Pedobacter mucosus]
MTFKTILLAAMTGIVCICGCKKNNNPASPEAGIFIDHGFIPIAVGAGQNYSAFQTAFYSDNYIYVATSDGIWKNNLTTKEWSRAGLDGKKITAIYKHPMMANKFFAGAKSDNTATLKTMYISDDAGVTWKAGNNIIFDDFNKRYEDYVCFAVRPDHPQQIYANLGGGKSMAVSTDGGINWIRPNNETGSFFGYPCNIAFLPKNPDAIYQGAESPLDDAWLGKYDISNSDPAILNNFQKIVNMAVWDNRRPNELQTNLFTGNDIYVGQEGALSKVSESTNKFIFKSDGKNFPYSYIYAIWIDPTDTKHLLFGGAQNGGDDMNLYETSDEGKTIKRFTDKMGFTKPNIREIVNTNTYPAIIVNDDGTNKVKLYLYKSKN